MHRTSVAHTPDRSSPPPSQLPTYAALLDQRQAPASPTSTDSPPSEASIVSEGTEATHPLTGPSQGSPTAHGGFFTPAEPFTPPPPSSEPPRLASSPAPSPVQPPAPLAYRQGWTDCQAFSLSMGIALLPALAAWIFAGVQCAKPEEQENLAATIFANLLSVLPPVLVLALTAFCFPGLLGQAADSVFGSGSKPHQGPTGPQRVLADGTRTPASADNPLNQHNRRTTMQGLLELGSPAGNMTSPGSTASLLRSSPPTATSTPPKNIKGFDPYKRSSLPISGGKASGGKASRAKSLTSEFTAAATAEDNGLELPGTATAAPAVPQRPPVFISGATSRAIGMGLSHPRGLSGSNNALINATLAATAREARDNGSSGTGLLSGGGSHHRGSGTSLPLMTTMAGRTGTDSPAPEANT